MLIKFICTFIAVYNLEQRKNFKNTELVDLNLSNPRFAQAGPLSAQPSKIGDVEGLFPVDDDNIDKSFFKDDTYQAFRSEKSDIVSFSCYSFGLEPEVNGLCDPMFNNFTAFETYKDVVNKWGVQKITMTNGVEALTEATDEEAIKFTKVINLDTASLADSPPQWNTMDFWLPGEHELKKQISPRCFNDINAGYNDDPKWKKNYPKLKIDEYKKDILGQCDAQVKIPVMRQEVLELKFSDMVVVDDNGKKVMKDDDQSKRMISKYTDQKISLRPDAQFVKMKHYEEDAEKRSLTKYQWQQRFNNDDTQKIVPVNQQIKV